MKVCDEDNGLSAIVRLLQGSRNVGDDKLGLFFKEGCQGLHACWSGIDLGAATTVRYVLVVICGLPDE